MVTQYRTQPLVVEALQWTGSNFEEINAFLGTVFDENHQDTDGNNGYNAPIAIELSTGGEIHCNPGDWLVREHESLAVVMADQFNALYGPLATPYPETKPYAEATEAERQQILYDWVKRRYEEAKAQHGDAGKVDFSVGELAVLMEPIL